MKILATTLALAALIACPLGEAVILETGDVQSFTVTESGAPGHEQVALAGLAFHSALAVERVEARPEGKALLVQVRLVPARAGLSGSFNVSCPVPAGVDAVVFGAARTPVWARGSGSLLGKGR